jgi:hypothetical protein
LLIKFDFIGRKFQALKDYDYPGLGKTGSDNPAKVIASTRCSTASSPVLHG